MGRRAVEVNKGEWAAETAPAQPAGAKPGCAATAGQMRQAKQVAG